MYIVNRGLSLGDILMREVNHGLKLEAKYGCVIEENKRIPS